MFKVMGGGEGRQPCSRLWQRSAVFKLMRGAEGRQPCSI